VTTGDDVRRTRLVLVHGSRLSASQWAPQTTRLTAAADAYPWLEVVTPDLPGHGGRSSEPFTLDRAVGALAAAVEAEPSPDLVVLAGHSLGGYVAATYAATFPRRLDGLVLLGAAAVPRGAGAAAYRAVAALTERAGPDRMTRVNDGVLGRLYAAELVEPVVAGGYWFTPTRTAWRDVMARCGPHQLRELAGPVLLAGGVYDQLMLHSSRYARSAPRSRVVRIPRAGHFAGFDRPDEVTALLLEFVRGLADGTLGRP
jgi:pimeloyl-ACP methyl ester carboxylesterase